MTPLKKIPKATEISIAQCNSLTDFFSFSFLLFSHFFIQEFRLKVVFITFDLDPSIILHCAIPMSIYNGIT